MSDMNRAFLVGRLTRDSELAYAGDCPVVRFSLASSKWRKTKEGGEEYTNFFECAFFGKKAEGVKQYLVKGKQVCILAELKQERWEKDGNKYSKVVLNVEDLQLIGGNKNGGEIKEDIPF